MLEAQRERTEIAPHNLFFPSELGPDELDKVVFAVSKSDKVHEAFLVRKHVQHFQDDPCYVLALTTRQTMAKFLSSEDHEALIAPITPHLEGAAATIVFGIDESTKELGKQIRGTQGAKIYPSIDLKVG